MTTIALAAFMALFFAPVIWGYVQYRKEERLEENPAWQTQCNLALHTVITRG